MLAVIPAQPALEHTQIAGINIYSIQLLNDLFIIISRVIYGSLSVVFFMTDPIVAIHYQQYCAKNQQEPGEAHVQGWMRR